MVFCSDFTGFYVSPVVVTFPLTHVRVFLMLLSAKNKVVISCPGTERKR